MNEIIKSDQSSGGLANIQTFKSIEDFQMFLNSSPDKKEIKLNKLIGKNADGEYPKYLSIGVIERKLDQVFSGLYNIIVTDVRTVGNEIGYTISLEVYHPIARIWLKRAGTGWAQIRMRSDSNVMDTTAKIKNAMVADGPHALAEAVKNAAKRYGVIFGRNLNREDDYMEYEPLSAMAVSEDVYAEIESMLAACETEEDLTAIKRQYKEYINDLRVKKMLINKYKSIKD